MEVQDRLIVALDFDSAEKALALVDRLGDSVAFFKVGLQLFLAEGSGVISELEERGKKIFLDLKFHDIPSQVANACREGVRLGTDMMTVHALGGSAMISAAAEAVDDEAKKLGRSKPLVMAVTILTSMDDAELARVGLEGDVDRCVSRLAVMALKAGANGVVASPREIETVRAVTTVDFALLTPGIRRSGECLDEQKRTLAPKEALSRGADFIVVGRPITRADDPKREAEAIIAEMGEV